MKLSSPLVPERKLINPPELFAAPGFSHVALKAAGAGWGDAVRRTIYTVMPTEYEVITAAIEEVTGSQEHPAQTIIGVTELAVPGLLIEIEVTALIA